MNVTFNLQNSTRWDSNKIFKQVIFHLFTDSDKWKIWWLFVFSVIKTTLMGIPYGIYPNMCSKYMYIYIFSTSTDCSLTKQEKIILEIGMGLGVYFKSNDNFSFTSADYARGWRKLQNEPTLNRQSCLWGLQRISFEFMLVNIPLLFLGTKHQLVLFFSAETMHSNSAAVTRLSTTTGALFTQFYFLFTKHF